jgi:soluble lytic murein transglycosylase
VRSHANAYGLMQLLPSTGRTYARKLKLRYSLRLLTTAEPNLRMGTAYFADKIREFGSMPLALASYNAGETPVHRWMDERGPGLPQEEFIDDIPYPETQNYVKRILGTAEDYRRLYGSEAMSVDEVDATPAVARQAVAEPKKASAAKAPVKKKAPARKKKMPRRTKKAA